MKNFNFRLTDEENNSFSNYCNAKGMSKEDAIRFLIKEAVSRNLIPDDLVLEMTKENSIAILKEALESVGENVNLVKTEVGPLYFIGKKYVAHYAHRNKKNETDVLRIDGEYVLKVERYAHAHGLIPIVIFYGNLDKEREIWSILETEKIPTAVPKKNMYSIYRSEVNDTIFFRVNNQENIGNIINITRNSIPEKEWFNAISSRIEMVSEKRKPYLEKYETLLKNVEEMGKGSFYLRDALETPPALLGRWFYRDVANGQVKNVKALGCDENGYERYEKR